MQTRVLSFDYEARIEGGAVDGRELAAEMIAGAWKLLLPYAKGCPACAENMLEALAAREIGKMTESESWKKKDPAMRFWDRGVEDRESAWTAHIDRTKEATMAVLKAPHGNHS